MLCPWLDLLEFSGGWRLSWNDDDLLEVNVNGGWKLSWNDDDLLELSGGWKLSWDEEEEVIG